MAWREGPSETRHFQSREGNRGRLREACSVQGGGGARKIIMSRSGVEFIQVATRATVCDDVLPSNLFQVTMQTLRVSPCMTHSIPASWKKYQGNASPSPIQLLAAHLQNSGYGWLPWHIQGCVYHLFRHAGIIGRYAMPQLWDYKVTWNMQYLIAPAWH